MHRSVLLFGMATITCKIPDLWDAQLEAEAARRALTKSDLVREALQQALAAQKPATAFQRIQNLCGIIKDGPADLSTNPKYMEDFGKC